MSKMRNPVGGGTTSQRNSLNLARVVALALLIGVIAVQPSAASSITKNFSSSVLVQDYDFLLDSQVTPGQNQPYSLRIQFQQVVENFSLTFSDLFTPDVFPGPVVPSLGDKYRCVEMSTVNSCVEFVASSVGGLPQQGATNQFIGPITIFIKYGLFGYPGGPILDPIDIGQTLDFSSFMIYANQGNPPGTLPFDFRMVHFHDGLASDITVGEHCDAPTNSGSFEECAQFNQAALVPEPGTTLTSLLLGLSGLTVFSRRLKRRD